MSRHTDRFWDAAEDWSRRKHLILSYYLRPAAPKLRTQSRDGRVFVLDGFAGRGTYKDGTPGSPVHMGQLAVECRTWNGPVDLTIHNVEPDDETFGELESCTREWAKAGYVTNRRGTFQDQLPAVLREVRDAPLFAFLDPFRPSHLAFDDIVPLLERSALTEICVVFHTPSVVRMLRAARPAARTEEDMKEKLRAALDDLYGSRRWESLLDLPPDALDEVAGCFATELSARMPGRHPYVCWHGIQARFEVGLKYHIVFVTRHPHGVRLMNDAFWKETQTAYVESAPPATPQLGLDFDIPDDPLPARSTESRRNDLSVTLIDIGKQYPGRTWVRTDLVFESLMRRFGEFSEAEHRQAIHDLLHRAAPPLIVALDKKPTKTGKWITNDDTRMQIRL